MVSPDGESEGTLVLPKGQELSGVVRSCQEFVRSCQLRPAVSTGFSPLFTVPAFLMCFSYSFDCFFALLIFLKFASSVFLF